MEGYRLIHTALLILRGTTRAQQDYGPTAVSTALSVPHSISIRHCYGSERSSGRGVLFSPAGPLFVQRPLFIPAAVRRVWILKGKVCGRQVIHSCLHTFIHSFIHLLNHSLIESSIHAFDSFIHLLTHAFIPPYHSFIRSCIHSVTDALIRAFIPSLTHSSIHSFIRFVHSFH